MAVTLQFYEGINAELEAADTLVVLARGLGMAPVLARFVAPRVRANRLILALNIKREVAVDVVWPALRTVRQQLPPDDSSFKNLGSNTDGSDPSLLLPRFLNADYSVADRMAVYATGGFIIVSDTVVVHDLLCRKLPVDSVDGIVVFAADRVKPNSNTHFALTLFRKQNRVAFVKALSENAPALTMGFHHAEKVMRTLFVSRLSNWPRFHKSVKSSFARRTPDVVDLSIPLSRSQSSVASALREIAIVILDDLRLASKGLDLSDVFCNTAAGETNDRRQLLASNFDDIVRRQLTAVPGRRKISGSDKVRSLVADLSSVRALLEDSIDLNAVHFYQRVITIRHAHERASYWLMRRESQNMLRIARSRVFVRRSPADSAAPIGAQPRRRGRKIAGSASRSVPSSGGGDPVGSKEPVKEGRPVSGFDQELAQSPPMVTVPILDQSPKWDALRSVLEEIEADVRDVVKAKSNADVGRVLVVARDHVSYDELRSVLSVGQDAYIRDVFQAVFPSHFSSSLLEWDGKTARKTATWDEDKVRGTSLSGAGRKQVTMTQLAGTQGEDHRESPLDDVDPRYSNRPRKRPRATPISAGRGKRGDTREPEQFNSNRRPSSEGESRWPWPVRLDRVEERANTGRDSFTPPGLSPGPDIVLRGIRNFFGCATDSNPAGEMEVLLWCIEWSDGQGRGKALLDQYRPSFVVMYNADVAFVRQVEVFRAQSPGHAVRLYLLAYEDRVDEDRYRSVIDREREAFKMLIRERATMLLHANQEGRLEGESVAHDAAAFVGTIPGALGGGRALGADRDSRFGRFSGGSTEKEWLRVVVDTRELRSSLPMHLHNSGMEVLPVTLEVGDFVLSSSIAIERKSVSDLYGSFDSGRLSKQAGALCRHYKHACLLVELDMNAKLSLASTGGGIPTELTPTSIVSKMVLLMQEFPTLRLLWAVGQQEAAELFSALKVNEDEPNSDAAAALGVDSGESNDSEFNSAPATLLRSLPGVDGNNVLSVMRKVRNVSTLLNMSRKEMAQILGSEGKAKRLYEFANEHPSEALAAL